jgi:hypothetical protein
MPEPPPIPPPIPALLAGTHTTGSASTLLYATGIPLNSTESDSPLFARFFNDSPFDVPLETHVYSTIFVFNERGLLLVKPSDETSDCPEQILIFCLEMHI